MSHGTDPDRMTTHGVRLGDFLALMHSGKVTNFCAQPKACERAIKDFWDRRHFGVRYLGPGHIIDFKEAGERVKRGAGNKG